MAAFTRPFVSPEQGKTKASSPDPAPFTERRNRLTVVSSLSGKLCFRDATMLALVKPVNKFL
jgi:hypothetical protein